MIIQAVLDFLRDVILNWISGVGSLAAGIGSQAAGAAIGGAAAQAGHFLALFVASGVWGALVAAWGVWLGVWLTTGMVAIFARRNTSS